MEPKQKQHPVVDVTGDESKVRCCTDQYCTRTWNINYKSRQIGSGQTGDDILGISKPKWTGMGEFNSDDHCIYYCGQESLRRNGVGTTVSKSV